MVVLVAAALEIYYHRAAQQKLKELTDYRTTCAVRTGAAAVDDDEDSQEWCVTKGTASHTHSATDLVSWFEFEGV